MGVPVRISNERLNCYGTWIKTDGMDIEQYQRNPVLLLMHQRGSVIGYVKNIKKEKGDVTGELEFDEATPESIRVKKQFEFGSLKMVSAGVEILELSEKPDLLVQGQTRPTITRCKLNEVSVVDIGGNDDAIRLVRDGVTLELGKDGSTALPLLNNKPSKQKQMDLKEMALQLGLAADASEEEVKAKIAELKNDSAEAVTLRQAKEQLQLSAITAAVEAGINQKRIAADKKDHFISLGKKIGLEELKTTIEAMSPAGKISELIKPTGGSASGEKEPEKLSDLSAEKMMELRKEDRPAYIKLFKAEYGFEPTFEEE